MDKTNPQRKKSQTMTEKINKNNNPRIDDLRKRFAAARFGKTERTNSFLQDPKAYNIQNHQEDDKDTEEPEVQPWLQEYEANDESKRQERRIRKEINFILGVNAEAGEAGHEEVVVQKLDPIFVSKKLKKYQPANSSFSLFYGEKKGIERVKANQPNDSQQSKRKDKFKLPALSSKKSAKELQSLQSSQLSNSARSASQDGKIRNIDYLYQIEEIDKVGEVLTKYSSHLINKIDKVNSLTRKKFGLLNQKTEEMIEDVGTYQLDQEKDGSYKQKIYEMPAWLLKK